MSWANLTNDPAPDVRTRARMTAAHIIGVVKTLGVDQASIVLGWLNWPKESFHKTSQLTLDQQHQLVNYFINKFERSDND